MRILTPAQTAEALPFDRLVPAIMRAAKEMASGEINAPERQVVTIDAASVLLSMPAIAPDIGITKLITVHGDNARHGLPAIQGEVVVFDTATGKRLALLDGPTVTARRTAAVTLLGIELLAPKKPASALLIGSGVQAAAHADGLVDYFGVTDFRIASRNVAHAQSFCETLRQRHPQVKAIAIDAATARTETPDTDLVIALTTSKTAVIPSQLLPHTLAIGVGAFKPDMVEFPADLLHERPIVVDHLAGAKHEAGDLLQASIDWDKVRDISQLVTQGGSKAGLLPVLKTVGHASWDLAAARVAVATLGIGVD